MALPVAGLAKRNEVMLMVLPGWQPVSVGKCMVFAVVYLQIILFAAMAAPVAVAGEDQVSQFEPGRQAELLLIKSHLGQNSGLLCCHVFGF